MTSSSSGAGATSSGQPQVVLPPLRALLLESGMSSEEIDEAAESGVLGYVAIDRFALAEPVQFDLGEISAMAGVPESQITMIWRSLGFPEPQPGQKIFTEVDADMLAMVGMLVSSGLVDPAVAAQMSRVIGWSLARVATAMIDSIDTAPRDGKQSPELEDANLTGAMLPMLSSMLDYVWRRHLQIASRRRLIRERVGDINDTNQTVGFADMVGFTTLSQQVDEHTLATVVGRFEEIAFDTVNRFEGRVVKMIGDEVMFTTDDPAEAVRIGLTLADEYANDEALSDVRVGIASGSVVVRDADIFGPVVNLASRIVHIAFPGSVVTDEKVKDAIADDVELTWKSLKPRRIKDIGRVPLFSVCRTEDISRQGTRPDVRERRTEAREARLAAMEDHRQRRRRTDG